MPIRLNNVDKPSTANVITQNIGTYHLADNPTLYEPQRSNNFRFLCDLNNIIRAGFQGDESNATIPNAQEILDFSVSQASVPHFSQSVITIKRGNTSMKFAGAIEFPEGTIAINDYIGADSKAILMAWQNLSGNVRTEKVGLAADYKRDAYLVEYTPDYQVVRQWVLKGCWVSNVSEDAYNSESNEKRLVTATIQYDRAYIDTTESI